MLLNDGNQINKYILVVYDSYGSNDALLPFHGKAIALDINENRAPLPLLFLVHEYRVRGRNFYQPLPGMEDITNDWQDWIIDDDVVNGDGTFKRNGPAPTDHRTSTRRGTTVPTRQSRRLQESSSSARPSGSRTVLMPPSDDLIATLMAYQCTMPSWKACQRESMSWDGTAEENIKKYQENVGVESAE